MPYYPGIKPDEPAREQETQKRPAHSWLRRLLPYAFLLMAVYGAVRLVWYGTELSASRETSRELQQIHEETEQLTEIPMPEAEEPTPSPLPAKTEPPEKKAGGILQAVAYPNNSSLKVSDRFVRLRKKSGYIVGWLSLDSVDEAVVLKDNTFFLNHDAEGNRNSNGAIFLDAGTNLLTRPYTVYLYGHNMKSGNMFGRLKKYLDSAYCYRHRIITFDSLYEDGKYAVFAAAEFSTVPGKATYYDLWSLDSKDTEKREQAIRRLSAISPYNTLLDVRADEQILLLVTCIDEDTDRLVVAARRLREDETETSLSLRKD